MLFLLALQAATLPDVSLHATLTARTVTIEKHGQATLEVHADPDAGSLVKVEAPRANGAKTMRNLSVAVDAEARIGNGGEKQATRDEAPR